MVSRLPFLYASPEALEQRFFDHAVEGRVVIDLFPAEDQRAASEQGGED